MLPCVYPRGGQVAAVADVFGFQRPGDTKEKAANGGYDRNAEYALSIVVMSKTCTDS